MSVPLPFYRGIDAIINKFDARSRWLLTESRYLFFYRFSFFISSWLQYTKSGFHEVRMERGLGQQTLPAQKCHQNISDMINVDILIYFFFSWSKMELIITQSILRLETSCVLMIALIFIDFHFQLTTEELSDGLNRGAFSWLRFLCDLL